MQREIKFRMFIEGIGMVYRGIYDKNWYHHPKECHWYRNIEQRDHVFPLMQFTGLKDKNGKEIYEGDIVSHNNAIASPVFFDLGMFRTQCNRLGNITNVALYHVGLTLEVIGNLWENPELLNPTS